MTSSDNGQPVIIQTPATSNGWTFFISTGKSYGCNITFTRTLLRLQLWWISIAVVHIDMEQHIYHYAVALWEQRGPFSVLTAKRLSNIEKFVYEERRKSKSADPVQT